MSDLCLGTSTLVAVGFMVGWPTAGVCFGAMILSGGRGRIWPWWLVIIATIIICAIIAVLIDQPNCRFNEVLAQHAAN